MKYKVYILVLIIFSSCKDQSNRVDSIIESFSGDEVSQSFFKMNERLISSIHKYESKVNFSDSLISNRNIKINTYRIIENYYESLEFASKKSVQELYDLNHKFLLDSLLLPHLFELHNQEEELQEIKEIAKLDVQGKSENYIRGSHLVKNQIFYNHIFQFVFRYKLEEELKTEYLYPIVYKDSLLPNKNQQLTIYLTTNLENDLYSSFLKIDGQDVNLSNTADSFRVEKPILFEYNPNEIRDEIEIKTYIQNNLNEETKVTTVQYKPIKK